MSMLIGFESWVERGHLVDLNFAAGVTAIASRRFWLCWRAPDGKARRHAPDFLASRAYALEARRVALLQRRVAALAKVVEGIEELEQADRELATLGPRPRLYH